MRCGGDQAQSLSVERSPALLFRRSQQAVIRCLPGRTGTSPAGAPPRWRSRGADSGSDREPSRGQRVVRAIQPLSLPMSPCPPPCSRLTRGWFQEAGEGPRPRPPVRRGPLVVPPREQCAAPRAAMFRRAIGSWIAEGVSTGARRGLPGTRRARQRRASATCRKVVGGRAGAVGLPDSSRESQKPRR